MTEIRRPGFEDLHTPSATEDAFCVRPNPLKTFELHWKYQWQEYVEINISGTMKMTTENCGNSKIRAIKSLRSFILKTIRKDCLKNTVINTNRVSMTLVLGYILGKNNGKTESRTGGISFKEGAFIFEKNGAKAVSKVFEHCLKGDYAACDKYLGRETSE